MSLSSDFVKINQDILGNFNPLTANPTKLSNTLKQFVGNLATNCLSVFDHFVILALKRLSLPFERKNMLIVRIKNIRIHKNKGFLFKYTKSLKKKSIYELLRHLAKL